MGEGIRRLVAKCIAKEAASKAIELFGAQQLGVGIKGGFPSIVRKILKKKLKKQVGAYSKFNSEKSQ